MSIAMKVKIEKMERQMEMINSHLANHGVKIEQLQKEVKAQDSHVSGMESRLSEKLDDAITRFKDVRGKGK